VQHGVVDAGVQPEIVDARRDAAQRPAAMRQVGWFIAVGCAAGAVHLGCVMLLVAAGGVPPLAANVGAWLVAFGVSFAGHHRLTFRRHGAPVGAAARRFFVVSAAGFAVNEAAYAVLLRWSGLRYDIGLALVLVAVAAATYWLGRHWAFLRSAAP
jgi:putative flippase GtrA